MHLPLHVGQQLRDLIEVTKPGLLSIEESSASVKPFADKWSLKEILGHLIDSAANNHQRIVRMQEIADLGTFGYSQQHWVNSQGYLEERWEDLVQFWCSYNAHLAHVISRVDEACLDNVCDMGYSQEATLSFVIQDYVRHVHHHLDQIFSNADPRQRKHWIQHPPSESQ